MRRFNSVFCLRLCLALFAYGGALRPGHCENAPEEKRSYNLPPGDASTTLNRFAAASERNVIFMVAKVQGVRTNAVVGNYSPADALDRMVENTVLRAITDAETGAFVVTRRQLESDVSPGMVGPGTRTVTPEKMKRSNVFQRAATAFGLLLAQQAAAQTANPAPSPANDEVVELSPFEVSATDEKGYVATSSLVGSRVNTELKDIASQIDVMTPEFLQDLGATTIADAVVYSSNFGGPLDQNIGPNDTIANTGLQGRARGMDAATVSTDFFASNFPIDFYNVERLNLAYGAQSVLFGLGNAGGVLDSSTKRALMRRKASLDVRFDDWGSKRAVLDVNQPLLPGKLAVRLVGLASNARQFTRGGEEQSLRGFGTVTYKPYANTTVRASYEHIDVNAQRATNYVSYDFLTPWVAAGRPLFDNSRGNGSITATDPLFAKNTNNVRVLTYGADSTSVTAWNGTGLTQGPHQVPGAVNLNARSLLDSSVYPVDIDPRVRARENNITGYQFRGAIEQRITDDLYFELGFDYERRDELSGGPFDLGEAINIRADPNMYLPGGTAAKPSAIPNPNAGKLYIESYPHGNLQHDYTQELRLTGFYEFSAAKRLGEGLRWLGRHRLATLLSTRTDRTESQEQRAVAVGDASFTTGDKLNNSRFLRTRYYLDPANGNYQAGAIPGTSLLGPIVINDPASNNPVTYAMFDHPEGSAFAPAGTKVKVDTAMAALQSFFLRDRVNVFAGLRQDHVKTYYFDDASTTRRDQVKAGDQLGMYRPLSEARYTDLPDAIKTADMRTYGVVVHPLRWASVFFNTSENTSLPPGRYGPWGNPLGGTDSDGYDYGFRIAMLQERLSVRVNFYEDNQKNFWSNPFTQLRNYSANIERRLRGPDVPPGIAPVAAAGFDPIANPVDLYRSLSDKTTRGLDVVLVANPLPNWTLRATVGRQKNLLQTRGDEWIDWIQQRLPVWQNAGGLGWDNVTLSSSSSQTLHDYYTRVIVPQITAQQLAKGTVRFREREWRANAFTNYRFTSGRLRGFNVGGGVRWWSAGMTGNAGIVVPGIADPVDDPSHYYRHADPQTFVDALVGYRRKIGFGGRRFDVTFQVNVRNVLDERGVEVSRTDQQGIDYEYVRIAPRQIIFSAGVDF